MSVLDQQCRAAPGVVFADIGSGGGGGGGGQTQTISSITVSSITSSSAPDVIEVVGGGMTMNKMIANAGYMSTANVSSIIGSDGGGLTIGGDALFVAPSLGVFFPTNGSLAFQDNKGSLVGISSVNGASYPPPPAVASAAVNPLNSYTYVPPGGATQSIATFNNLVNGHWYEIKALLRYSLVGGAVPGAQDSIGFTLSGNLDTWANNNTVGCSYISTLQNDVYQNICIVAKANNSNPAALRAYGSPAGFAVSTSVGCEVPIVITDLGAF